jgi:hypothetical protein
MTAATITSGHPVPVPKTPAAAAIMAGLGISGGWQIVQQARVELISTRTQVTTG